jgi:hypothetical protein
MKFYVTSENTNKIKKSFLNLKLFAVIDVLEILTQYGYTHTVIDKYGAFIVNKKILDLIEQYTKSKRIIGIIYCNQNLNEDVINELYETLEKYDVITDIVLLDDYNVPKMKEMYGIFDEIVFFPSIRKIRLVECKPLSKHIDWKF